MKNMKCVILLFTMFFVVGVSEVYAALPPCPASDCAGQGDLPHTGLGFETNSNTPATFLVNDDDSSVAFPISTCNGYRIVNDEKGSPKCYCCDDCKNGVKTYLDANGGGGVPSYVSCGSANCNASLPTPTKENCTFDGWYSARQGKNLYSYADCANNGETLVAQWKCGGPKPGDDEVIIGVPVEDKSSCYLCESQTSDGKTKWEYIYASSIPTGKGKCSNVNLPEASCSGVEYPEDPPATEEQKCYLCLNDGHFSYGSSPLNKQGSACSKYTVFSSTSEAKCNSSLMPSVTPTCYSTITYKLNGGKFLDGTTADRTQVLRKGEKIGEFKTNPIKSGYKFVCWTDSDGECYTKFNDVIEVCNDITLIAKYEKDDSKYCCEKETDIYDPSKGLCYDVLKTYENKDPFNYTTYTYQGGKRYCYGYYGDSSKPGVIVSDGTGSTPYGKNNNTEGVYAGYISDAWRASNTCRFRSECRDVMLPSGKWKTYGDDCVITWKTILYKVSDSVACPVEEKEPEDIPESPDTGSALIYVAWAIGFGALGYSIYYLNKYKKRFNS